ncbi:peptide-methionine (S)-S-oxide reductase MsrA [Desemzia sp. FAM 24101]|uniref:peptide-methionine (S)-S-oxide reductase MsrA n=1 Tax=unclassified Desemzia TaxID=2685243 RepID=UPI003887F737
MRQNREEMLNDLYNLILDPATREWERSLLLSAKNALEDGAHFDIQLSKLEADLRPLALRNNLTPDVTDFYNKITNTGTADTPFDLAKHSIDDPVYQDSALFAGGCFWCMVEPFENRNGIISVLSGYTGGHIDHPTYDQVSGQYTGHVEAVEIIFDTRIIQYADLVELYWQLTDPTDASGQFQDRGSQYRPVIFVKNEQQRQIAEASKQRLADSGKYNKPIVTSIESATVFWPAENYHQQFYKKNPKRYKRIERSRRQFLAFQRLQGRLRTKNRKSKRETE